MPVVRPDPNHQAWTTNRAQSAPHGPWGPPNHKGEITNNGTAREPKVQILEQGLRAGNSLAQPASGTTPYSVVLKNKGVLLVYPLGQITQDTG